MNNNCIVLNNAQAARLRSGFSGVDLPCHSVPIDC